MSVTARFVVSRKTPMGGVQDESGAWTTDPWAYEVEMTPDYAQGSNEEWKAASPSGVFRITIDPTKTRALDQLEPGTKLHIVMTPYVDESELE